MRPFLYIPVLILGTAIGAFAQASVPTPTPLPQTSALASAPENAVRNLPPVAPDYRSTDRSLPDISRVGVDAPDQLSLTLHDALERALANNKDIEISRKTETMAEFDLSVARGFYQPRLAGATSYERTTTPNLSIFSNQEKQTQGALVGNVGLTGYVPKFGSVLASNFYNNQVTLNNTITLLSPQYNSGLTFSLTQPLFRGRKFDQPRRTIEIAKRNIQITDIQFRQRTIDVVTNVQRAYWDLVYALRNLQVQADSLRDARSQLEHNRRLVNEGQLAPIDIVAADTQVANYEQTLYDGLNTVNLAENQLKNLISPNRSDAIWSRPLMPVESVELTPPNMTLGEAIDTALQNRPELEINRAQKELNSIDQRFYREQKKPQIDLIASYGSSGVGGRLNPVFSNPFSRTVCVNPSSPECIAAQSQLQTFLGHFGGEFSSLGNILTNKYPTFRFGVQFNLPLWGDKTAAAQLGHARVEALRLEDQREQVEQGIQVDVRNALQSIRVGEARLRAASIARENTEKQYESEQRKLEDGQSDVYRVLERQTALSVARSSELRARTDLNKSIAELQRATGNSLKANDIRLR